MREWALKWIPTRVAIYLNKVFVRRVGLNLLDCPAFHRLGYSDHRTACERMTLGPRPIHWKFNLFLMDWRELREQLTRLVHRELVEEIIVNKW